MPMIKSFIFIVCFHGKYSPIMNKICYAAIFVQIGKKVNVVLMAFFFFFHFVLFNHFCIPFHTFKICVFIHMNIHLAFIESKLQKLKVYIENRQGFTSTKLLLYYFFIFWLQTERKGNYITLLRWSGSHCSSRIICVLRLANKITSSFNQFTPSKIS